MGVSARQTKVGINKATSGSWGLGEAVATAVGSGDGHYVRDDIKVQLKVNRSRDDSAGQNFIGSVQTATKEAIRAAIPMYLHYNDTFQNILWALTLGTGGTSPSRVSTTTAYTNTFEPATNKTGVYATIVRDKVQMVSEVPGAKFTGFEIAVGDNGRMEVEWKFIGNEEKSDSSVNTSTQVSALTFPTLGLRAFFDECVVRLNTQSGGALATPDDVMKFTSLKIMFEQPLDVKYVGGQLTIIEPEEDQFPDIRVELEFARYDSTSHAFFAAHRDGTKYKADITFTGAAIDATSNYGLMFQFPNMDVAEFAAPIPGGAGQSVPKLVLTGLSTTSAPTGMSGVTKPIRVVTTGTASANPFA